METFFKLPEKIDIFRKFAWKIIFFVKLPEKVDIFRIFAGWKNRISLQPGSTTPRFQIRLTPLMRVITLKEA